MWMLGMVLTTVLMRWYNSGSWEDRVKQLGRSQPWISAEQAVVYSQIFLKKFNGIQPQRKRGSGELIAFQGSPSLSWRQKVCTDEKAAPDKNQTKKRKHGRGGTRRAGLRKSKVHLELNLLRYVRGIKKDFYRYLGSKRKTRENVGWLLYSPGNLVIKNVEKAKVASAFFSYIFSDKSDLQVIQVLHIWEKIWNEVWLSLICVILYLVLHLHYLWLIQPVNSSRQGSVFINLASKRCYMYYVEQYLWGYS